MGVSANALVVQRAASTSGSTAEGAASSWKTNAVPVGATAFAIGTVAWYSYIAGRDVDAMTPAEEG
jgi:ubiquinol-cytochrome c reductase cytochrome c1 subunit